MPMPKDVHIVDTMLGVPSGEQRRSYDFTAAGLTLERIFDDLPNVPFEDAVWPRFLRENALRVLKP